MNTFVVFVALAAAFAVAASASPVVLTGQFTERRPEWAMGFLKGQFYYLYDASDAKNCRLRLNYVLDSTNGGVVANLYHYEDGAMYSISGTNCTGLLVLEHPDPWWLGGELFDKTDQVENGMVWYVRKAAHTNASTQVMKILMKEGSQNPNTANYLGAIEFYNGHNLTFQSVTIDTQHSVDDPMFAPINSCPKPTCPIYADIVFVLDSSGSVRPEEWRETVQFVDAVMNSFTFGKNAVEAAVIHFCGQDASLNSAYKVKITEEGNKRCQKKDRWSADYNYPKAKSYSPPLTYPDDRMANYISTADYGNGPTVSPNKEELMRLLNQTLRENCSYPPGWEKQSDSWREAKCENFPGWRGTCQALGLKLAMEVLDRSPRKDLNTKPHNIVIVVTDGEDKFPNMTARNATLIKKDPYDALLIEVGVGLDCEYDKNYLRNISSRLGSETSYAYFDSADYASIRRVVDQLYKPLCDSNFSTACGPECKGFCAAGQCLCPDCDLAPDVCHFVKCNVSGGFSNGCVMYDKPYEIKDDECTRWECDADFVNTSAPQNGKWNAILNQCEEMNNQYPGECRQVECDPVFGGCRVTINETVCQQLAENACVQYECTPLNLTPPDLVTGCRLKSNFTQNCWNNLGPRISCMAIKCDGSSLKCEDMEYDTCKAQDTACETYKCQEVAGGAYDCVPTPTPHPDDTSCVTWKCDDVEGWYVDIKRDETYCKEKYVSQGGNTSCKTFYCNTSITDGDIEGGCTYKEREGCDDQCTEAKEDECKALGVLESNNSYCILDYCIVERNPDDEDNATILCASERSKHYFENCLDESNEAYKTAKQLNEANPANCYTPYCNYTECIYVKVDLPAEMAVTNYCMEPRCVQNGDGSWGWVMKPTKLNETCHSDACYIRECVPESGCVVEDNCTIYSDECYKYSCQVGENNAAVCAKADLTVDFQHLECMNEICKDGKKTPVYSECHTDDKCMVASCVKGGCVYTPISPPGDDLCMTYTCDNTTGNWTITPNCDDGLYCTMDECWNYGTKYECRHDPVECSERLSMKGYDCFMPFCKENVTNFRCVRKLLSNAYIDICGNCIQDKPEQQYYSLSSEVSIATTEESVDPHLIECTGAPARPMMVETLAAATIGLIIIAAVIVGAATTTSAIIGTKTLIARVREANNMAAQCNPLFEGIETEMTNPTYAG